MKSEQFANAEPKFRVEEYFLGQTRGWGIFEDRFGDLRRQFVVDIDGAWEGEVFVMTEAFRLFRRRDPGARLADHPGSTMPATKVVPAT